jgi:hypothetical protein
MHFVGHAASHISVFTARGYLPLLRLQVYPVASLQLHHNFLSFFLFLFRSEHQQHGKSSAPFAGTRAMANALEREDLNTITLLNSALRRDYGKSTSKQFACAARSLRLPETGKIP